MSRSNPRPPSKEEMDAVFALCRNNHWSSCLQCLKNNPMIGTTVMIMDNHIATTVCHQAITSKGDVKTRAEVIIQILSATPEAAAIQNGYKSLCLHSATQRNVKMDAKTKERVILALIAAYPQGLVVPGGVGRRTPLHIVFTDYVSPKLTRVMVERGKKATFMEDTKGYLAIHVAVSRHCSPDKLRLLIKANPDSIVQKTKEGKSVLDLARATATKSHPNYALINAIEEELKDHKDGASILAAGAGGSNDSKKKKRAGNSKHVVGSPPLANKRIKQEGEALLEQNIETPAAANLLLNFSRANVATNEKDPRHAHKSKDIQPHPVIKEEQEVYENFFTHFAEV